jgi:hypothetical protein
VCEFAGKMFIEDEGALESAISGACVEFVIYVLGEVLAMIIEAKTEIIGKSKGQLFLEMNGMSTSSVVNF